MKDLSGPGMSEKHLEHSERSHGDSRRLTKNQIETRRLWGLTETQGYSRRLIETQEDSQRLTLKQEDSGNSERLKDTHGDLCLSDLYIFLSDF